MGAVREDGCGFKLFPWSHKVGGDSWDITISRYYYYLSFVILITLQAIQTSHELHTIHTILTIHTIPTSLTILAYQISPNRQTSPCAHYRDP